MKTYTFTYAETGKQVWGMILGPLLLTAIYVILMFEMGFDKYVPFWVSVSGFIGSIIICMLWLFKKALAVPATVSIDNGCLKITLARQTLCLRKNTFILPVANIKNFNTDTNPQADYRYYFTISTKNPSRSFTLTQGKEMPDEEAEAFRDEWRVQMEQFNQTVSASAQIKEGSFFDAAWARVLTWCMYAALVIATIVYFAGGHVSGLRLIQLYCVSFAWLGSYYAGRSKKKAVKYNGVSQK